MNAWTYLMAGIVFEVIGTTFLKLSDGFSETWPSTLCIVFFVAALYMLSQSVKSIEIGVVYAIWSGVGIAFITLIGAFFFHEVLSYSKIFFIGMIIVGVIGLQMATQSEADIHHAATQKGEGS